MNNTDDFILTTAATIEGYRVVAQYGLVFGETVFKHGLLSRVNAGLSNAVDSFYLGSREMSGSVSLLEKAREYAYNKMIETAKSRGANAIIAIDSDNTIGGDIMYISLYGTAVKAVLEEDYEEAFLAEKAEREKRKADVLQRNAEIEKMKEIEGELWREKEFLRSISNLNTVNDIWELWCKSGFSENYKGITAKIKAEKDAERMYGKRLGEVKKLKTLIEKRILENGD